MLSRSLKLIFLPTRFGKKQLVKQIKEITYASSERISELVKLCNVTEAEAEKMLEGNKKLHTCDLKPLKKLFETMRNLEIDTKNLTQHPKIATFHPATLKNRYLILIELGFKNVTMKDILRYCDIMKTSITSDAVKSITKFVEGPENLKESIERQRDSTKTLKWLHRIALLEYLAWKLDRSLNDVIDIMDKYPSLANSSITNQKEVLKTLLNEFKFTKQKIQANGFLMTIQLESVHHLTTENPILAGMPIREFVLRFPRILLLDALNVKRINEYLQRFDITNEQTFVRGNIYTFNSETVLKRLEQVEKNARLIEMKSSHRFLELIYYFDKVQNRLSIVKELNLKHYSLTLLTCSEKSFRAKLAAFQREAKCEEISRFLVEQFKFDSTAVNDRLCTSAPVDWFEIDANKVRKTVEYLLRIFTRKDVLNNLDLVLFDVESVKEIIDVESNLEVAKEKLFAQKSASVSSKLLEDAGVTLKYGKNVFSKRKLTVDSYLNPKYGG